MRLVRSWARVAGRAQGVRAFGTPLVRRTPRPVLWWGAAGVAVAATFGSMQLLAEEKKNKGVDADSTDVPPPPPPRTSEPSFDDPSDKPFLVRMKDRVVQRARRMWQKYRSWMPENNKVPSVPPMLAPQYRRPFVLVVDLDAIIYVSYLPGAGWRTRKRPGVDYFLSYASQVAEVIAFSSTLNPSVGWTLMPKLDPMGAISYKFFDEFDKDVLALQRPMDKMLIVGLRPEEFPGGEANFIALRPWPRRDDAGDATHGDEDTELLDVCTFLQELQRYSGQLGDVRTVLAKFRENGKNIVDVYHEKTKQKIETRGSALTSMAAGGRPTGR